MYDNGASDCPTVIFAPTLPAEASENTELEGMSPKFPPTNDITLPPAPNQPEEESHPIPHNKSITYWSLINNDIVFVSLDIKPGGEYCGIVQLSAILFHLVHSSNAKAKDRPSHVRLHDTFDEYVHPGDNALWDPTCTDVHVLSMESQKIVEARGNRIVWSQFSLWLEGNSDSKDVGVIIAYNGETCYLKWLWK
jgi:hypothetical protein